MFKLTRKECLARAGLYEEAVEHIEMVWGAPELEATRTALKFVGRHLRREIDRWEVQAQRSPDNQNERQS